MSVGAPSKWCYFFFQILEERGALPFTLKLHMVFSLPSCPKWCVSVIFLMGAARKTGTMVYVTGTHVAMGMAMAGGNHIQVTIMVR